MATADPLDEVPPALCAQPWSAIPGLRHGFFGRQGGVSEGPWAALNLSAAVGDDPSAVARNWERVGAALPGIALVRMHQVHGARTVRVDSAAAAVGEADAMITATPGVGLAVLTADCVPLLGVAVAHRAVLVAHAGWRGTLAGVAVAALTAAREELGIPPEDWRIALGPAIDGCCYEVQAHIGEALTTRWGAMPNAWRCVGQRGQLDLRLANRAILCAHGVADEDLITVGPCTSCRADAYFSHRRSGGRAGRQLSAIGFAPA